MTDYYYNASTGLFQTTPVFNTGSVESVAVPAAALATFAGSSGTWKVATEDAAGATSPASSTRTITFASSTTDYYFNASTGTLSTTPVWNSVPANNTVIPAEVLAAVAEGQFAWKVATKDQAGATSPFSTSRVVNLEAGATDYYYNNTSNTFSTTPIWNTSTSTSKAITAGTMTSFLGKSGTWKVATKDAGGLAGPFSAARSIAFATSSRTVSRLSLGWSVLETGTYHDVFGGLSLSGIQIGFDIGPGTRVTSLLSIAWSVGSPRGVSSITIGWSVSWSLLGTLVPIIIYERKRAREGFANIGTPVFADVFSDTFHDTFSPRFFVGGGFFAFPEWEESIEVDW